MERATCTLGWSLSVVVLLFWSPAFAARPAVCSTLCPPPLPVPWQTLHFLRGGDYRPDPGSAEHRLVVAELEEEAQRQYALVHENIVRVYGVVEEGGHSVWIMMERGIMALSAFLASYGPRGSLPLDVVLWLSRDVLAALVHLHGQTPRVVHFDLKPPNVVRACARGWFGATARGRQ